MRLLPTMLATLVLLGCQTAPPDYRALTERLGAGEEVAPGALREAFLNAPDLPARMERLIDLESQALAIVEDEPLKLGSIGTAILDTYYGSLTGHYVLARFYEHVAAAEGARLHERWAARISADIAASGSGTREDPLPAVTPVEARMFVLSQGSSPVGAIYQSNDETDFSLLLQARPDNASVENLIFDLSGLYRSMRREFHAAAEQRAGAGGESPEEAAASAAEAAEEFTPFTLIGYLAKQNDTAAQAAVGAFLATQNRTDEAVNWLRAASRTGNLLANSLLARLYWEQARSAETEAARDEALDHVMENYLHAIALGSADAMYALGVLYINGHYGDDNKVSGVPLLKQAAGLEHSDAIMFLAHLHYAGEVVDKDLDAARRLYAEAAELGNPFARKSYARFLLDRDTGQQGDPRALAWLEELAAEGEAESMLLLGNLHARGVGTEPSIRRAVDWYKQAVEAAPEDPGIVNEVAWTLTVTEQDRLRRERYARRIMDRMMEANDAARQRPEYLDTWAATYAANGDFDRAVVLQQQAVEAATAAQQEEVLEILQRHLEVFRAGETVSEAVP
jgi:TPR repeat protein